MKILFLHIPKKVYVRKKLLYYYITIIPNSLFGLSDLLYRKDHEVEILHLGLAETLYPEFSIAEYINSKGFDVVCISLYWHFQISDVSTAVGEIKKACPNVEVILGGATASYFCSEIMENISSVDCIIRGEAERTLVEIVASLENGVDQFSKIPNVSFRKNGQVVSNPLSYTSMKKDMDRMSYSNVRLLKDQEHYDGRWYYRLSSFRQKNGFSPCFYLFTGRGCSVNCVYCGGGQKAIRLLSARQNFVFRDEQKVIEDVLQLREHGFETIYFCFDPPRQKQLYYYNSIFKELRRRRMDIAAIFEFYNRLPDQAFLYTFANTFSLKKSQIAFSPSSADESLRGYYNGYYYSNSALEEVLQTAKSYGIKTTLYFTLFPKDNNHTIHKTQQWMKKLSQSYNSQICFMPIEVEPGSPWYENPERYNLELIRRGFDSFYKRHKEDESNLSFEEKIGYRIPEGYQKYLTLRQAAEDLGSDFYDVFLGRLYDEGGPSESY